MSIAPCVNECMLNRKYSVNHCRVLHYFYQYMINVEKIHDIWLALSLSNYHAKITILFFHHFFVYLTTADWYLSRSSMSKVQARKSSLSKGQIKALKEGFDNMDMNCNGKLDPDELADYMRFSGHDTRYINAIFRVFDEDHDNGLCFGEFVHYVEVCSQSQTNPKLLFKMIFDTIDVDKDGRISVEEIMEFSKLCCHPLTYSEALAAVQKADDNSDGLIDFDELCKVIHI